MNINSYEDLKVWQKSIDMCEYVYEVVRFLPKEEIYALGDQIRRAAVSIPSNIAEGQARNSKKEFVQFLSIARGSAAELKTQLIIAFRLQYIPEDETNKLLDLIDEISRMITGLIKSLQTIKQ